MSLMDAIRRARRGSTPNPVPTIDLENRRILLVYIFPALGDAVLLAPIVKALLERGAKPPIGLLLRASAARIWKHVDLPVRIHVIDERLAQIPEPKDEEAQAEILKLKLKLEKPGYHIAADLSARNEVDARLWMNRSGAPIQLGFLLGGESEAPTLTWATRDERFQALEHWTQYLAAPLRPLGLDRLPATIPFKYPENAQQRATNLWGPSPRVLVVPGSRSPEKRLPTKTFIAAGRLATQMMGSVVVTGAPNEAELVKEVVLNIGPGAERYTGKALGPLLALVESADAVVTNDTGPMHLAYLTDRPTVAIFTSMSPLCWGPMRTNPRFVTLTLPEGSSDAATSVMTRVVLDRLDTLLATEKSV